MSKREKKWSQKYNYVLVHRGRGVEHRIQIGRWGAGSEPANTVGYELLYRNPAANWGIAAHWIKGARKHPDYFGYQGPPAEPEALAVGDWVHVTECFELDCDMTGYVHLIDSGGDAWIDQITGRKPLGWEDYRKLRIPRTPRESFRFVRTEKPADSAPPFTPKLDDKVKGKPGAVDHRGSPIPAHDAGRIVAHDHSDSTWRVYWHKEDRNTGSGWYKADALEAL